jgi:hypothetical protein
MRFVQDDFSYNAQQRTNAEKIILDGAQARGSDPP